MELFRAHNQWAKRPPDERFWDVVEGQRACAAYRLHAREKLVTLQDLRVENVDGDLGIVGKLRVPATLTHWAFGQVSKLVEAPASYLRKLPPTLAAQNLNHGLKNIPADRTANLLFHQNGNLLLRAALSESYHRIWNDEIFDRLLNLPGGWRTPPARPAHDNDPRAREATERDVIQNQNFGGLSVNVGDRIAPAGVYVSDHDMFVFQIDDQNRIDDGSPEGLMRGFFVWNSEVGGATFGAADFLFKGVCGNHIIHGVQSMMEMKVRHVGTKASDKAWRGLEVAVRKIADSSAEDIEGKIKAARGMSLGGTKDEVIDAVLGIATKRRIVDLTRRIIIAGVTRAEERTDRYGDPTTLWAVVNGLTEISQDYGYADRRTDLDRAAGKLLQAAF